MKKAFTIIELLVVIGIIGVLAGILLTTFSGGTESARAAKCLNNMRNLAQATISVAMSTDYYPAAGSYPTMNLDDNGETYYAERRGWISWLSADDPYHTRQNTANKVSSVSKVAVASACCANPDEATFAITNGAIWKAMNRSRDSYLCPLHVRTAQDMHKPLPNWSYAMSSYFGYDVSQGSDGTPFTAVRFGGNRLDRKLLFAEIPFAVAGSMDSSYEVGADDVYSVDNDNPPSDAVLQYKAKVPGSDCGDTDWSGRPEAIAFNHRVGKKGFNAHVAFADGHVEKFAKAKAESGLNAIQLTAALCEGLDVSFTGGKYELVNDGDKSE